MNYFDDAIRTFSGFPGYAGDVPTTETEYNEVVWSKSWANPTWTQVQVAIGEAKKNVTKTEAKKRIATTDWSVLPDVGISNTAEFEAYRAALRELIKNPVADPVWPTEPEPVWS